MNTAPQSSLTGLTDAEAEESRRLHGSNLLTPPPRESVWKLLAEKFGDPIIRILIIAALLSLIIAVIHNDYIETIGIIVAILLATGIGFWFEYDASRKFDVLNSVNDDTPVRVLRNGRVTEIGKKEVVVGDVVLLETGEEIPADGELAEATHLIVNESTLTGEPSISKTVDETQFKSDATYPSNRVYRGTTVLEGHGVMRVTEVGDATEYGRVARASGEKSEEKTPLTLQLEKLAGVIGVAGFALAFLTFVLLFVKDILHSPDADDPSAIWLLVTLLVTGGLLLAKVWLPIVNDGVRLVRKDDRYRLPLLNRGWLFWSAVALAFAAVTAGIFALAGVNVFRAESWVSFETLRAVLNHFMIAVTLIVVAVPEGLPMSVTLSLALNMRRMLKSNNLVRKMHACETMGAINVICTDKTGTLTRNQMRVADMLLYCDAAHPLLAEGIAVNSTAHLDRTDAAQVRTIGNPTEAALLLWLDGRGTDYAALRAAYPMTDQITFSTQRKYMATQAMTPAGEPVVFIKGAPEIVLKRCDSVGTPEDRRPLTPETEAAVVSGIAAFQNQAMRTLGLAYKIVREGDCQAAVDAGGFSLLGVAAISDPVRDEVPAAVQECLQAGIDVKIVTGDTPATAKEIARQIGLWDDARDAERGHLTGVEFEALSDEALLERILDLKIMSRARPGDKQRLVRLLQRKGCVVAVTGDGTNDAPALNYAHVGLSMGSGTSVAKEASDITLLDDSFNSIATAVMWGRSLYKNIQRFLLFQLTINVIAVSIVFLGALTGSESPLTITQMLWVNLIMDTFAAAALASLPPSRRVMREKPRRRSDFIITRQMTRNIFGVGLALVVVLMGLYRFLASGTLVTVGYGMSLFFSVFVLLQFWNMFNAKSFGSGHQTAFKGLRQAPAFLFVALLIVAGQILIVSFGGQMFRVEPLAFADWIGILAATSLILWIGEAVRLFARLRAGRNGKK